MRFFGWLFLATLSLVLMVQLRLIDGALTSPDTPWGIVGFELAFTQVRAADMLSVWDSMGVKESALVSLGVDVAFLLVYPFMLRGLVQLLRRDDGSDLQRIGARLAAAVLVCIPLDALENALLWRELVTGASTPLALVAGVAASIKFLLVLLTAAWCVGALVTRLFPRPAHG
ncbi:hypothetical protein [Gemmatimonas groenlandica]|uniref:Uncharacterized protein n=1 Tax=Gemmatimonas groenlandica TaxID=2732249 RepID=A0A6M4IQH9_9BACT|nr:hypothetical protein [Gemmatimonas groenlandica]QJR36963.1 hypothetical protein HKW67_16275 [Gemmatimonas groenlandica]